MPARWAALRAAWIAWRPDRKPVDEQGWLANRDAMRSIWPAEGRPHRAGAAANATPATRNRWPGRSSLRSPALCRSALGVSLLLSDRSDSGTSAAPSSLPAARAERAKITRTCHSDPRYWPPCGGCRRAVWPRTETLPPSRARPAPGAPSARSCGNAAIPAFRAIASSPPGARSAGMAGACRSSASCCGQKGSKWVSRESGGLRTSGGSGLAAVRLTQPTAASGRGTSLP